MLEYDTDTQVEYARNTYDQIVGISITNPGSGYTIFETPRGVREITEGMLRFPSGDRTCPFLDIEGNCLGYYLGYYWNMYQPAPNGFWQECSDRVAATFVTIRLIED